MKSLLVALQMLTIIPLGQAEKPLEGKGGRAAAWFSAIGAVLAIIAAATIACLRRLHGGLDSLGGYSTPVEAVIVLGVIALLTGALHLDGLADTFDGIGARRGRERALEIMRDSRIGTFGVCGLFFILALKISLLCALPNESMLWALALALMGGRWGMTISCARGKYAREDEDGLGNYFIAKAHLRHVIAGAMIPAVYILFCSSAIMAGLLALVASVLLSLLLTRFFTKRLGGITGDTLGATNELCETMILLVLYCSI